MKLYDFLDCLSKMSNENGRNANVIVIDADQPAGYVSFQNGIDGVQFMRSKQRMNILLKQLNAARFKRIGELTDAFQAFVRKYQIPDVRLYVDEAPVIAVDYNRQSHSVQVTYGFQEDGNINESILDTPKESLDGSIWRQAEHGWALTEEAETKINSLLEWVNGIYRFMDMQVFIIGSMTSNSYSSNSDIDVNICSSNVTDTETAAKICAEVKKKFAEYTAEHPDDFQVGGHPFEVYVQYNPFRCLASVGCYDFLKREWLVGPEFKDRDFDPTSEYYKDNRKGMDDIRNTVLDIYELAVVISKSHDQEFRDTEFKRLVGKLKHAKDIFTELHDARAGFDKEIDSEKTAQKLRTNKKRNKADAEYKFLDKFGYIPILREYSSLSKETETAEPDMEQYIRRITDAVKQNLNPDKTLADSEQLSEEELDEGLKEVLTIGSIAAMLAIPGVIPQSALAGELKNIPKKELRMKSPAVTQAMNKASVRQQSIGGLSYANATNLAATVAYNETMLDYIKFKDRKVIIACLNSIENRAGGVIDNIPKEILRTDQYYGAKNHVIGYAKLGANISDANYRMYDPHTEGHMGKLQEECWKLCNELAVQMYDRKLENVIGYYNNMLANEKKDNKKDWEAWGKNCKTKVGSQAYGYDKAQDGYIRYKTKRPEPDMYVVQPGDSLWKIAKSKKTTVDDIKQKNNLKTDTIRPGQKLRV